MVKRRRREWLPLASRVVPRCPACKRKETAKLEITIHGGDTLATWRCAACDASWARDEPKRHAS